MSMRDVDLSSLAAAAGIGVAGNFTGHLEQAGEAVDFTNVAAAPDAPKGIFPWYMRGRNGDLGVFPVTHDRLELPGDPAQSQLQIEPEVGVIFAIEYGDVPRIRPTWAGAFNDCSIRRPGAAKISEKKNWGPASKGLARRGFALDDLEPDGGLARLRIASFLRRNGRAQAYGVDSPARGYRYVGRQLCAWFSDRLQNQHGSPDTPLEPVGRYLDDAGRPATLVVGIGATRYTPLGESTYLTPGDESIVIVYDEDVSDPAQVASAVEAGDEMALEAASVLVQRVIAPGS